MKNKALTVSYLIIASLFFSCHTPAQTLVPQGSVWKYLDDGSNQGTAWITPSFDDSNWASGPAQLGYGDGDEATTVSFGGNSSDKHPTTYFRHDFTVADASIIPGLELQLLRDDGAIVYLNGSEIYRSNVPNGPVGYNTYASSTVSGSDEDAWFITQLSANLLVNGSNTLAVEIHQRSPTSSDISFDLTLLTANFNPVRRGPYLQSGTANSMVIRWRTDSATETKVSYGLAVGALNNQICDATLTTEHEAILTGLSPNTVYYYSIGDLSTTFAGDDADHYFKTSPPIGTVQPIRAWVLGDSGTGNGDARAVRDAYYNYANGQHTDLLLMLGDNAYTLGLDIEYQVAMFENMYEDMLRQVVTWPCPGNHEYYGGASATNQSGAYYDIFTLPKMGEAGGMASGTEAYYSYDYGNVHFISLDSHDTNRSPSGAMLTWLQNDLANTTQQWIIAYWHHPPYSKGSHDSDSNSDSGGRMIDMRENALPILEAGGVDLVLGGHSHSYERSYLMHGHYGLSNTLNNSMILNNGSGNMTNACPYQKTTVGVDAGKGAVYIVAGSSGKISSAPLDHPIMHVNLVELGSLILDVTGERLDVRFINDNGAIQDYFTIIKDDYEVGISATNNTICNGQNTTLIATGAGLNGSYQWDNGAGMGANVTVSPSVTTTYTVTITDAYNCLIDTQQITVTVNACAPTTVLQVNAFLEGAYIGNGNMSTGLGSLLPDNQPFNTIPWQYNDGGSESGVAIPTNAVDWVLLEIRAANNVNTIVEQRAAWLLSDGSIKDVDGVTNGVRFQNLSNGNDYYLVLRSRNHLAVLSAQPISITANSGSYDFTDAQTKVQGNNQLTQVETGIFALHAGDIDANGVITVNDFNGYQTEVDSGNTLNAYLYGDLNLDANLTVGDFNIYKPNASLIGVVEIRY